jgi:hypothetical protein
MNRLEPGDILACPVCDLPMLECLKRPAPGEKSYIKCFKAMGFKNKPSMKPECPECHTPWAMHDGQSITAVYVKEKGWVL